MGFLIWSWVFRAHSISILNLKDCKCGYWMNEFYWHGRWRRYSNCMTLMGHLCSRPWILIKGASGVSTLTPTGNRTVFALPFSVYAPAPYMLLSIQTACKLYGAILAWSLASVFYCMPLFFHLCSVLSTTVLKGCKYLTPTGNSKIFELVFSVYAPALTRYELWTM